MGQRRQRWRFLTVRKSRRIFRQLWRLHKNVAKNLHKNLVKVINLQYNFYERSSMGANSALIFGIIINVAILLVFFRFLMQLAVISPYNPVVLSTVKATKIVDVFGRIFPTLAKGRVNTAALALLVVLYLLKIFGMMYLSGGMPN